MRSYRFLATLGMILLSTPSYAKRLAVGNEEMVVTDRFRAEGNAVSAEVMENSLRSRREWNVLVPPEARAALGFKENIEQPSFEQSIEKLQPIAFDTMTNHMTLILFADHKIIKRVVSDWDTTLAFYGVDAKRDTALAQNEYSSSLVTTQAHPQTSSDVQPPPTQPGSGQPLVLAPSPQQTTAPVATQPDLGQGLPSTPAPHQEPQPEATESADVFHEYSEAFQPALQVYGAQSVMLSQETQIEGQSLGWEMSFTRDLQYWATLTWTDSSVKETVPLISRNTVHLLGTLAGMSVEDNKGIVFGKIAAGWDVELSGHAHPPVLLTLDRQPVVASNQPQESSQQALQSAQAQAQDRYFAFVNVQPGPNLLYFKYRATGLQGAVAAPVEGGKSTYLNVMDIRKESVSGRVVLPRKAYATAAGTTVRVLGQDAAAGVTGEDGTFEFSPVMAVAKYPIYFETDRGGDDFTYRYRFLPSQLNNVVLRRMTAKKIQGMLNQLPGGAQDGSGMILANANRIVDSFPEAYLYPEVTPMDPKTRMLPQTYVPAPGGELLKDTDARLSAHKEWFVGLQVPEGTALASVKDETGKVLGSQMIPVSPGTVYLFEF